MSTHFKQIGFIGLGVMGEPMCRNLLIKSKIPVSVLDANPAPVARLVEQGAASVEERRLLIEQSDIVFLSLPSGEVVEEISRAADGLLVLKKPGQIIVDLSTTEVELTRRLAADFSRCNKILIDAPVARTRAAAEAGTLSVMVGADPELFQQVLPLLETFASDITLCGPLGCGQVVKILNNMVLFEIVTALSEARSIARGAGVDVDLLFETLSKGSADSFALRNHGMKAMLRDQFPERAFSVEYARKDLRYALQLARATGVQAKNAQNVDELFGAAISAGDGALYWPVISRLFEAS